MKESQERIVDDKDSSLKLLVVLTRAYQSIRKGIEEDIKEHGLNLTEFGVLELLYHKGDQPIQKIGGKILIASSSTTYVIDQLVKKQLLKRKPSPTDRRITYGSLTAKGQELMEKIFPDHRDAVHALLGGLTTPQKQDLIVKLKELGLFAASINKQ
ncbi:MarR family winged helix-turn-helix transcriptional regulator [Sporolactobacillus kofuensis]|uniref:MarR family winged helix-turn-helix transcriptional regulator n=1 Tax=Sporolactobacillus kofuensis TaxID=269672 RepID=A0ABW1WFB1_9BACL|nr:MarR family transcriptional regulator [Sporolactobacillus kofuensis]MCO7176558.1 MarR family transcriptional regulator [Sporolactobacillus kofuensis]